MIIREKCGSQFLFIKFKHSCIVNSSYFRTRKAIDKNFIKKQKRVGLSPRAFVYTMQKLYSSFCVYVRLKAQSFLFYGKGASGNN
jgi:hypothetical protein